MDLSIVCSLSGMMMMQLHIFVEKLEWKIKTISSPNSLRVVMGGDEGCKEKKKVEIIEVKQNINVKRDNMKSLSLILR